MHSPLTPPPHLSLSPLTPFPLTSHLSPLTHKARNHVNRMCLAADIPLVESGTAGYLGQVTVIRWDRSFVIVIVVIIAIIVIVIIVIFILIGIVVVPAGL